MSLVGKLLTGFYQRVANVVVNSHSLSWSVAGPSQVAQMVKNPPAVQEMQVQSLGQEDPLEKEMAAHS